jgi:hypothetical protein
MALDVEFDVLEPPALKERLRRASERMGRSLARGVGEAQRLWPRTQVSTRKGLG